MEPHFSGQNVRVIDDLPVRYARVDQRPLHGDGPGRWLHVLEVECGLAPPEYLVDPVHALPHQAEGPVLTVEPVETGRFILRVMDWAPSETLDPGHRGLLEGCLNEGLALAQLRTA